MKINRRGVGIAWLVIGAGLIVLGSAVGWAFAVMGLIWVSGSGEELEEKNPETYKKVTIAGIVLAILALVVIMVIKFTS